MPIGEIQAVTVLMPGGRQPGAAEQNGGITVTFSVALQSASQAAGPFSDVPGNPQGTYTIPRANLETQSFFRTVTRSGN
jgi:hypothetical protein